MLLQTIYPTFSFVSLSSSPTRAYMVLFIYIPTYIPRHFGCEIPSDSMCSLDLRYSKWVREGRGRKENKIKLFSVCGPKHIIEFMPNENFCLYDFGFTEMPSDRKSIAAIAVNAGK